MENIELCPDDISEDAIYGFSFLSINIVVFFSLATLLQIDWSWFSAIFGIQLIIFAVYKLKKSKDILNWNSVEINIVETNVTEKFVFTEDNRNCCFLPKVKYEYFVNNQQFFAEQITVDMKSILTLTKNGSQKIIDLIKDKKIAYYNPQKPQESVVFNAMQKQRLTHFYALGTIGIILILFTVGMLY